MDLPELKLDYLPLFFEENSDEKSMDNIALTGVAIITNVDFIVWVALDFDPGFEYQLSSGYDFGNYRF